MNRRSFFGIPFALSCIVAAAAAYAAPPRISRISIEKGDPGEFAYAAARADGKRVKVFLDGAEQRWCRIADAGEGWVKRMKLSPEGHVCHNAGEVICEVVHGHVEIQIV